MKDIDPEEVKNFQFTYHQLAVMQAWSEYETVAKAAAALGLAESTIQTHFKRMRGKLNVKLTFDIYKYMTQHGLL